MKYFMIAIMLLSLSINAQEQKGQPIVETYGVTSMYEGNYNATTNTIVDKRDIYPKDESLTLFISDKKSIWIMIGIRPLILCDDLISYKPGLNYDLYTFGSVLIDGTPSTQKVVRFYNNPKRLELQLKSSLPIIQLYLKKIKTGSLYTK